MHHLFEGGARDNQSLNKGDIKETAMDQLVRPDGDSWETLPSHQDHPSVVSRDVASIDVAGASIERSPDGEWPLVSSRSNSGSESVDYSGVVISGPGHHDYL